MIKKMNRGFISPKLKFPIIIKTKDGTTTFYSSAEPLIRIYRKTFDNGLLIGVLIIDSNGKEFRVDEVINLGYTHLFWGINVFLGREIFVEIRLQQIRELDLDEFIATAVKLIKNNGDYFISAGRDLKHMKLLVNTAKTNEEIVSILTGI